MTEAFAIEAALRVMCSVDMLAPVRLNDMVRSRRRGEVALRLRPEMISWSRLVGSLGSLKDTVGASGSKMPVQQKGVS